ncbi:type I restriction endonuclease subunit R [Periweissella fabaria]|uniref:Type I restriction enzyme endonuclease subunit n=1 Tax=Periweissella fabaria TaxID=546157 RepID=A0ABM8Z3M5_9LACO|nr:HsdR family type I site-specific deoxyribonuclease [Periweissella fabaria]MCM0596390.1 type I restriction endonuclease subunit R [Periweissella fabaria]CAH0415882.1 Type-1 restriction enzyme R protein [Periweissella fabaria]
MNVTKEAVLEDKLIEQLIHGDSQWTLREDIKDEAALWANFFAKLSQNNTDKLNDEPLTDQEKKQIQNKINFTNFFEAAKWLAGENGIAKIDVQRDNADLGTARLHVLNRQDVAGGMSSYEVVHQVKVPRQVGIEQDRRFDVILLINGLPLIQIELKSKAEPFNKAFNQIKKYLIEDKFTGIFSALQMFVVTNGADTKYIASAQGDKLNEKFLSGWSDVNNTPVTDYLDFAHQVLSIPQAHKMVTQYTVLDSNSKSLIMLRPYQIHAIEAVKAASRRQESGYVWHTTGSGKTLTAYKVARNLLQIPSLDKTIFIVDRVDLDQQTTSSFTAYAENDVIDIDQTDNVSDLVKKLTSDDRTVIVSTIQKLIHLMKRCDEHPEDKKLAKIRALKVAFVVDECHRAVSAAKQQEVTKLFGQSLWYGFTGTPIFAENAKAAVGDLARTTEQQYGTRLHEYTIKEAIHDNAVLGFQVEYKSTFTEEELDEALVRYDSSISVDDQSLADKEAQLPKDVFLHEDHMWKVVESIVNKSKRKLRLGRGSGNAYEAILTTSSIAQAQKYYDMFQAVRNGKAPFTISQSIREVAPDFPKVAVTYSVSENEDTSIDNQAKMKASMQDYNEMFNTRFSMDEIRGYNNDVNSRLARKKSQYVNRDKQLDIVIVVDRLLTGFDAPAISTLFIDRAPMKPHALIQAFSRTNQLFDKDKAFGQIVTFQTPGQFEAAVQEALILYSNGGEAEVLAPTFDESEVALKAALADLHAIAASPEHVNALDDTQKKQFAKAFQALDKAITDIQVYTEFADKDLLVDYKVDMHEVEDFKGKYENVLVELKSKAEEDEGVPVFDIEYELSSFKTDKIDYSYIVSLMQQLVPSEDAETELISIGEDGNVADQKLVEMITKNIHDYANGNKVRAEIMQGLLQELLEDREKFRGKSIITLLNDIVEARYDEAVHSFADTMKVDESQVAYAVNNYQSDAERHMGVNELVDNGDLDAYKAASGEPINKLKYKRAIRNGVKDLAENVIGPLMEE